MRPGRQLIEASHEPRPAIIHASPNREPSRRHRLPRPTFISGEALDDAGAADARGTWPTAFRAALKRRKMITRHFD